MLEKKSKKKVFIIQRIYVKDVSFEAPNTPEIFEKQCIPTMKFNLNTNIKKIKLDIFEIVLQVRVIVESKKDLVFLCDVYQAGIFFISNLDVKELEHCTNSYCPNILFPYARACISSLVSFGSFPQLNLAPVNFDDILNTNSEFKEKQY
ncbi:protein-export chaperone SecB [Buchnera aphidicola]|uniref:Protein-export protein SecB n=1 Tax=Buchnera aphidicola (Aphis gossypii) TaxID=98785 RepID=A0A5J6ZBA9_9GAMM|nr:protein-export chaperone SecB [Buchnera aphidicola]QFQ31908.1 protein-export chaperone SecB [Buchnera aphidicola (Aphis gossypii)]UPT14441.1 protein-export chaperone SecB [Buchnera aphidicola (Aphis gossypii)]